MKTLITILAALILSCNAAPKQETSIISTEGRFHGELDLFDNKEDKNTYYHFKSDDNEVWWLLTESEIGHIPNSTDKYILTYDNGGTPEQDLSICGCKPEWECECHKYDDEFISIRRIEK